MIMASIVYPLLDRSSVGEETFPVEVTSSILDIEF